MKFTSTPTAHPTAPGRAGMVASAGVELRATPQRGHVAQPSHLAGLAPMKPHHGTKSRPRTLYRRPSEPGVAGTTLMRSGWAGWITDPPSEETL